MKIIEDNNETFLEKLVDSWTTAMLFILLTIIALSPLAMAIAFTIMYSPWWLFLLAIYLFIGPYIILGYIYLLGLDYLC